MNIILIGCGCGDLTEAARTAIEQAELLIGSARPLARYGGDRPKIEAAAAPAIAQAIRDAATDHVCVLYSGDSGFYSGARALLPLLEGLDVRVLPGLSSVQTLAARLQRPWQDWRLFSAHGRDCDAVDAVCHNVPAFFLTGGANTPRSICQTLTDAGLGFLKVAVGEDLGTLNERVATGAAAQLAGRDFSPLSVLLAEPAPRPTDRAPGLPDAAFLRAEGVPMTKRLVRAAALALLAVEPTDLCWDVGAGTGSVSVELALHARAVYGVERDDAALALAAKNREKHGAWRLRLVNGEAPEALAALPAPDAVFVGGSGGKLREILAAIHAVNPRARVCVAAVTLETQHLAHTALRGLGYETELTQLAVTRGKSAGSHTLMRAENPVSLIAGYPT